MTDRTQSKLIALLTAVVCVSHVLGTAYSSGMTDPVVQGDARSYFAYLPSIVFDADLDLTNQFDVLRPEGGDPRYPFGVGANGYAANVFPVGPALLWLPGYLLGTGLDRVAAMIGVDTGPPGYGRMAGWGAAIAAILWAGLGFELCSTPGKRSSSGGVFALAGDPRRMARNAGPLLHHDRARSTPMRQPCSLALSVSGLSWRAFRENVRRCGTGPPRARPAASSSLSACKTPPFS